MMMVIFDRSRMGGPSAALIGSLLMLVATTVGAAEFRFQPIEIPGAVSAWASDMNSRGEILGGFRDAMGDEHTFIHDASGVRVLSFPISEPFYPTSFNSRGVFATVRFREENPPGQFHGLEGVLYDGGALRSVQFPGAEITSVSSVNNDGTITGSFIPTGGFSDPSTGFVLDAFGFDEITYPGATHTVVAGVNDSQSVIVGSYGFPFWRGFVIRDGEFEDVDYPGAQLTLPADVNDRGTVVGTYTIDFFNGAPRGFVLLDGAFLRIHIVGATETEVVAVGNSDWIVGNARYADGHRSVFIGVPVPEPPAIGHVLLPLVAAILLRRKRILPCLPQ